MFRMKFDFYVLCCCIRHDRVLSFDYIFILSINGRTPCEEMEVRLGRYHSRFSNHRLHLFSTEILFWLLIVIMMMSTVDGHVHKDDIEF